MPEQLAPSTRRPTPSRASARPATAWVGKPAAPDADWPLVGAVMGFVQDQRIYCEGDAADMVFKIVSGVVRTCRFLADGRRQVDAFHIAGDVFGIAWASRHSLCAEAVCGGTVIAYRRRGLDASALASAGFSRQLLSHAVHSLTRAQDHALLLSRKSALEKVAAFLVDWASRSPDPAIICLAMTRQDIADYLGLTIETVSRTLSLLEREAVIAVDTARWIRIQDPAALRAING